MTLPVRRHVLVDVDGVLADFDRGFLHLWRTAHPDRPWLAPAARRHFYLREDYPPAWRDAVQAVIDAPGFYRQLPVMAGAQAALAALAARLAGRTFWPGIGSRNARLRRQNPGGRRLAD